MTTAPTNAAGRVKTPKAGGHFRFPDPPEIPEDKMTSFNQLTPNGTAHHLVQHLGNPDTTLVAGEHYLSLVPTSDMTGVRYPDLLVAFGVDPAAYYRSNAYVISEQGKPPDFVLEIVSRSSRQADRVDKREDYAALGIPEYWRFDEAARRRENRLAGDRLVDGVYEPIVIEELEGGVLQGYSVELNLYLRWEQGQLRLHDPATGQHIATFESERARAESAEDRADSAESRARQEEEARVQAEARADSERAQAESERVRADSERARAESAEAQIRELEAENRRLRGG